MQSPPDGFEPVVTHMTETVGAAPLVVVAYGIIWAAVLLYLWILHRRQARLRTEIDDLSRRLAEKPRA